MIKCCLQDMFTRVYPTGNHAGANLIRLAAARGARTAFQIVAANRDDRHGVVKLKVEVETPQTVDTRIRRIGFVPLPHFNTHVPRDERDGLGHVPGFVPDPLYDTQETGIPPGEAVAFWITVKPGAECRPGIHRIVVHVLPENQPPVRLQARLRVYPVVLPARRGLPVVQWFYNDALMDWYKCHPFDERFWQIVAPYMANLPEHGQDTILVPAFTPPTDGVKRPTQLLDVRRRGRRYEFNWRDVKRYVDLARRNGIRNFEWNHFFSQWGVKHALRIYEGQGIGERLLWPPETPATSPIYKSFLSEYMPGLHRFLARERLLDRSFFHVSDEPHGEDALANYRAARALLKDVAPWMKTMDALSEIIYGREKITDMPVPVISVAKQYYEEHIPSFAYFCCGPRGRYVNRLLDTPLVKIRMLGWLLYRFRILGFLHWGYNYWYKSQTRTMIDPFAESAGGAWPGWAYGDPFVVYPGPEGPLDSIRWEMFAMSMEDYALLQARDVDPEGRFLADFRDFNKFPKTARQFSTAYRRLLGDDVREG